MGNNHTKVDERFIDCSKNYTYMIDYVFPYINQNMADRTLVREKLIYLEHHEYCSRSPKILDEQSASGKSSRKHSFRENTDQDRKSILELGIPMKKKRRKIQEHFQIKDLNTLIKYSAALTTTPLATHRSTNYLHLYSEYDQKHYEDVLSETGVLVRLDNQKGCERDPPGGSLQPEKSLLLSFHLPSGLQPAHLPEPFRDLPHPVRVR